MYVISHLCCDHNSLNNFGFQHNESTCSLYISEHTPYKKAFVISIRTHKLLFAQQPTIRPHNFLFGPTNSHPDPQAPVRLYKLNFKDPQAPIRTPISHPAQKTTDSIKLLSIRLHPVRASLGRFRQFQN